MIRTVNVAERNVTPNGGALVAVPAGKAVFALPDQTINAAGQALTEILYRSIMNVGPNPVYYAFGQNAGPNNFHGILLPAGAIDVNGFGQGSSIDASNHRLSVSLYSPVGTTVAVTVLYRNDGTQQSAYNPLTGPV